MIDRPFRQQREKAHRIPTPEKPKFEPEINGQGSILSSTENSI
jgi:hypothetical protein